MDNAQDLNLDGCAYHTHGENDLEQIELFPNGKNTMINNDNKHVYITEMYLSSYVGYIYIARRVFKIT